MDAGRTSSHFNDSRSEPRIITASYVVKIKTVNNKKQSKKWEGKSGEWRTV